MNCKQGHRGINPGTKEKEMAAQKKMTIRAKLDGQNDIRFVVPQTKANVAKLVEMFGEPHVIIPRNTFGRWGKAGKPTVKVSKPRAKRTTATA